MRYYPINLDVRNRNCLVVGGGDVATRKAVRLVYCGARVTVVSPETTDRLKALADRGEITLLKRTYRESDLDDMVLVMGATNNSALNLEIYRDAERKGRLCNIADQPDACNFILPSVVERGDLVISISTSGSSPAFAKKLRKDLEAHFGEEYEEFLKLMGAVRKKLLRTGPDPEAHKQVFEQLIEKGLLEMIRSGKIEAIDSLLEEVLGKGYNYHSLMESKK